MPELNIYKLLSATLPPLFCYALWRMSANSCHFNAVAPHGSERAARTKFGLKILYKLT
jgi:hypothetical protein